MPGKRSGMLRKRARRPALRPSPLPGPAGPGSGRPRPTPSRYCGSGPVATGRVGSADHCDQEPA
ncbi:hypothetical protein SSP531S_00840 [Streptomyces spongiicola]|uniref:Uncharacterized protein n=1 Tax=Streptomyces spongiicola TaxID=1690221 RepID=A0A388SPY8_9ACTN|nr:hypothetical protein SSP531S_00840 [Streptomyces spongiicola]